MYERILVGTDGSPTAALAVDRAVEVAAASKAKLTIMSVGKQDKAQAVVDAEAQRHAAAGVDIEALALSGDPSSAIVEQAENGRYDLVVVGNKGMTGASRFFLGSVPNKVSHHIPTALLIVRTT
ncbi:MAG: universal stress protein [Actinobacteria bacterium]|nr:universal stress protein [Actinomycetota bacterium]